MFGRYFSATDTRKRQATWYGKNNTAPTSSLEEIQQVVYDDILLALQLKTFNFRRATYEFSEAP